MTESSDAPRAVSMRATDHDRVSFDSEPPHDPSTNSIRDRFADPAQVERHEYHAPAGRILHRERLAPQVVQRSFGGSVASTIPRHPHGLSWSDHSLRCTGLPFVGACRLHEGWLVLSQRSPGRGIESRHAGTATATHPKRHRDDRDDGGAPSSSGSPKQNARVQLQIVHSASQRFKWVIAATAAVRRAQ
jgi:hypothetical protein